MKTTIEDCQELFTEVYLYDNLAEDFPEDFIGIEHLQDLSDFVEWHFPELGFISDEDAIREFANSCYMSDKAMLSLFFKTRSLPMEERQELVAQSSLSQSQKLLAMGFSVEGIRRLEEWATSVGIDLTATNPWEAVVEFRSMSAVFDHFKISTEEEITDFGSWEQLKNGNVLFMY